MKKEKKRGMGYENSEERRKPIKEGETKKEESEVKK
jgi:hypothetical protein